MISENGLRGKDAASLNVLRNVSFCCGSVSCNNKEIFQRSFGTGFTKIFRKCFIMFVYNQLIFLTKFIGQTP